MYPNGSSKFSSMRPPSPTSFVNFSPPSDYPSSAVAAATSAAAVTTQSSNIAGVHHLHSHHHHHSHPHHSMSMKHNHSAKNKINNNNNNNNNNIMSGFGEGRMVNSATMGGRNELMFPDDVDSIEFCMPDNMLNGDGNGIASYPGNSFTERRRRGHSRRSNHRLEVEQQVKWTRKNIAATMERFEPTSSKIDYGTTTTITPQQQQQPHHHNHQPNPINHVYSYAYYEPGAAKCHTNIPTSLNKDFQQLAQPIVPINKISSTSIASTSSSSSSAGACGLNVGASTSASASIMPVAGPSKSPPRNSIRALLAKSFRSKTLGNKSLDNYHSQSPIHNTDERHTYTTRYGTTENLYEEVNDQKIRKVLSDNRIVSISSPTVKEELRRVQHNHFRVLDELNLSLEALIMPPTPPDISPTVEEKISHASSMENLSSTLNSIELKDHTCINPEFDEGDLDSGFSGSGSSSGASYNESLRYYKTGSAVMQTTTLPHNVRSCRNSTASGTSTSKSSMNSEDQGIGLTLPIGASGNPGSSSPFNFVRRCSDSQRSTSSGGGGGSGYNNGIVGGTKPKKHFWTIKQ